MADSFQQRISLEGAEDIIKNLQAIGSEATKAIGQLKTAITSANPALAALSTTSLAAQNAIKGFGTAVAQATTLITPFSASLGGLLNVFGAFAGPAGVLAAVGGLGLFLKSTADTIVETNRQAQALGLSIEQFKALSKVAKEAGVSQEQVARSLTQVAQQVAVQARQQLGGIADILKELVSGNIPGLTSGQSILSKIIRIDDINKLKSVIASIIPDLRAFAAAAGLKEATIQNADQFAAAMLNVARSATPAGEALRKLLAVAANADTAITPFEKISEQLVKSDNNLTSLRLSFLNGKAAALDLFNALLKISDQLSRLPAGPAKTALERNIAGRFGPEVLTALQNAKGIAEELQKQLDKIGVNTQAVKDAKELEAAFARLNSSSSELQNQLLLTFGPTFTSLLDGVTQRIKVLGSGVLIQTPDFTLTFQDLKNVASKVIADIKRDFSDLAEFAIRDFNSIDWSAIWGEITKAFQSVVGRVRPAISDLVGAIKEEFSGIGVSTIVDGIVQGFTELPGRISALFGTIDWASIFLGIGTAVNTAIDSIVQAFAALPGRIVGALSGLPQQLIGLFQGAVDAIVGLWDRVVQKIREVLGLGNEAASTAGGAGTGTDFNPGGFAGGGFIRGAGTGTSDSILARLSRGEFVIRAAAVQHYGPELMAALNAMRLPRLPGFSLGGLADGLGRTLRANLAIPGMAAGGPTPAPAKANTVPITLDLRTDRGRFRGSAMADREVAEALSRFAVLDQITSMGKKSGAY